MHHEERRRQRSAADVARGRVNVPVPDVALEPQQFANEEVEVGVGDLRAVEGVVPLVVVGDLATELGGAGCGLGGRCHACECKQLRAE
jgi:hypothetical protein